MEFSYSVSLSPLSFMFAMRHMDMQFIYSSLTVEKIPVSFIYSGNGTYVAILTPCCPRSMSELHIFLRSFLTTLLFTKNESFPFFMQFIIQKMLLRM